MKKILFTLLLPLASIVNAQISYLKKEPPSFNRQLINSFELIDLDMPQLLNDSKKTIEDRKDVPQIFALPISVDLSIENNGTWVTLPSGDKIWRLKIKVENAENLNFHFNKFELVEGTEFYIYDENKKDIRGAFNHKNNRIDKTFATYLLKGDVAILEYYQPSNIVEISRISLSTVYYGLKGITDFGDSGGCNINVNCPLGADWQIEKRASALIISGGIGGITWCSGAMVNNVREDGTPYYLTANHCLTGTENNWAFIFNYESPNCNDIDGTYNESILGATVLANDGPSDFALLLLDDSPPPNYGVYHSGWDANDVVKDSTVGIHHPSGDIKKISFDYDSVVSSGYFGAGNDHWEVLDWNEGTTEGGSSGSPLYDKEHKIIGQLHGGNAACGNDAEDYYGKFSYSWNTGATASTRLKDWLDPDNTGTTVLDGGDFNTPQTSLDASGSSINGLEDEYCDLEVSQISYTFSNLGGDTLTNAKIDVYLTNSTGSNLISSFNWTGSLAFTQKDDYNVPAFNASLGTNELMIIISGANGAVADSNITNDTIVKIFNGSEGNLFEAKIQTDFWGYETSFDLKDSNDLVIMSGDNFSNSSLSIENNCIENGCYTFTLYDSYPDGIQGGGATLTVGGIDIHFIDGDNFIDAESYSFCLCDGQVYQDTSGVVCETSSGNQNSINEFFNVNYTIAPNPTNGIVNISSDEIISSIELLNVQGKSVGVYNVNNTKYSLNIMDNTKGMYYVKINTTLSTIIEKLILN